MYKKVLSLILVQVFILTGMLIPVNTTKANDITRMENNMMLKLIYEGEFKDKEGGAVFNQQSLTESYVYDIGVIYNELNNLSAKIYFNYQDTDNTYILEVRENQVQLKKIVNGVKSLLTAAQELDMVSGREITFSIIWQKGGFITIKADDKALFNMVRDTDISSGRVGATEDYASTEGGRISLIVRDPWLWPFAQDSIWNTPIGSNAKYQPANLEKADWMGPDHELLYKLEQDYPVRNIYGAEDWLRREASKNFPQGHMEIPDDIIVKDASLDPYETPNNCSAFLAKDGRTVIQLNPLTRTKHGGDVFGWRVPDQDIYGQGIIGGHGGALLSTLGGSIRKGELTGQVPIRHALKVNLWGAKYFHYDKNSQTPGFRWPAIRADSYAEGNYGGKVPGLVLGSLLAIPPEVTEESMKFETEPAKILFRALQDYGAYVADDAYWNAHYFNIEAGATREFREKYNFDFSTHVWGAQNQNWYRDLTKLFTALHIVENNTPDNVGGGGIPRAPLAPSFINEPQIDTEAPAWVNGSNLTIHEIKATTIELSWPEAQDNVKVTGYNLYLNGEWADWTWGETRFRLRQFVSTRPLKPDTEYTIVVKATDLAGNESAASEAVTVRTLKDTEPPTVPQNLTATNITDKTVDLRWASSKDNVKVSGYMIYVDGKLAATVSGTNYTVTGLNPSKAYSFCVRAVDMYDNISEASNTVTVTTKPEFLFSEVFANSTLTDWELVDARVNNGQLVLSDWSKPSARAIYNGISFFRPYSFSVDVKADGGDIGNRAFIYFNYQDINNTYVVRLAGKGRDGAYPELFKRVDGNEVSLGKSETEVVISSFVKFTISIDLLGNIKVLAAINGENRSIIEVKDTFFTSGKIGFGMAQNIAYFDNVLITRDLSMIVETVEKAEMSFLQADVDEALALVNMLSDEIKEKTNLLTRLAAVQEAIELRNAISAAEAAVSKAEQSRLEVDIDAAKLLVSALPDIEEKEAFLERLKLLEESMNKKPQNNNNRNKNKNNNNRRNGKDKGNK
jgi:chitodextrinase